MEFGRQPKKESTGPPNYRSRSVQVRLFILVSMLMLVVLAAEKAADPKTWAWMGFDKEDSAKDKTESAKYKAGTEKDGGTKTDAAQKKGPPTGKKPLPPGDKSELDFWRHLLRRFSSRQNKILRTALFEIRHQGQVSARTDWQEIQETIVASWNSYHQSAFLSVAQGNDRLTDKQKAAWLRILEDLKKKWSELRVPAFAASITDQKLSTEHQEQFDEIQSVLDMIYLEDITDGTALRNKERPAWYRLLEQLHTRDAQSLCDESLGHVNYVQMMGQPENFRGKLVSIKGEARGGYRFQVQNENIVGIKQFHVLVVKPDRGANAPVLCYCLDLPSGFPQLDLLSKTGKPTEIRERVELTGFFFKNRLYPTGVQPSGAKSATAPLVLVKSPTWTEHAPRKTTLPPKSRMAMYLLAAMAIGVVISMVVYLKSRWANTPIIPKSHEHLVGDMIDKIDEEAIRGSVLDSLGNLETDETKTPKDGPQDVHKHGPGDKS